MVLLYLTSNQEIAEYSNCKNLGFDPTKFSFCKILIIIELGQQFIYGRIIKLYYKAV